jgi:S-adenosylmethionine synthetase
LEISCTRHIKNLFTRVYWREKKEKMNYKYFSSESVCSGHPDKICDQISDGILDEALSKDKQARVAVETLVTGNHITVAGEVTCKEPLDYESVIRKVVRGLGYDKDIYGFSHKSDVSVLIVPQSPDIAIGVDDGGAGDQGMMFGYAINETENLMPMPIMMAHALVKKMDELRIGELPYLRPDGKSAVSIEYVGGKPKQVDRVVLAVPFSEEISKDEAKFDLFAKVVEPTLEEYKMPIISIDDVILNGTGIWRIGGPKSDTGVTGRKIIVDTYGGMARHGGGAFSGKDPTKVDRSAAYATRYLAKNIVAAGLADRCEVKVAYAIGYKDPIAKSIETFGTEKKTIRVIEDFAWNLLELSVGGIINGLDLRQPIYQNTAAYGHFGWNAYPWENIVQ